MAKPTATKPTKMKVVELEPKVNITKSKSGIVTIPGVRTEKFKTLLIGTSLLVTHSFSQKLRGAILAKHMGEASAGREKKDPEANFEAARYRLTDGGDGVPAGGVKAAIVKGFSKTSGVAMTKGKGGIRITADDPATNLVRILGPAPTMREDVVRNQSGVVDIRHRPQYWPWAMQLEVEFLPSVASMQQVLQAIATAGFVEGLCEWRPGSKDSLSGTWGAWRLATAAEVAKFEAGDLFETDAKAKRTLKRVA